MGGVLSFSTESLLSGQCRYLFYWTLIKFFSFVNSSLTCSSSDSLNKCMQPFIVFGGTSGGVMVSKPTRVSSSLIRCPIHLALCYIEAKSFGNYNPSLCLTFQILSPLKIAHGWAEITWEKYGAFSWCGWPKLYRRNFKIDLKTYKK